MAQSNWHIKLAITSINGPSVAATNHVVVNNLAYISFHKGTDESLCRINSQKWDYWSKQVTDKDCPIAIHQIWSNWQSHQHMCLFPLQPCQQLYYQTWGNVCQFEMVSLWSFNLNWSLRVTLQVFSYIFHLYFPLCTFFVHYFCSVRLLGFSRFLFFFSF